MARCALGTWALNGGLCHRRPLHRRNILRTSDYRAMDRRIWDEEVFWMTKPKSSGSCGEQTNSIANGSAGHVHRNIIWRTSLESNLAYCQPYHWSCRDKAHNKIKDDEPFTHVEFIRRSGSRQTNWDIVSTPGSRTPHPSRHRCGVAAAVPGRPNFRLAELSLHSRGLRQIRKE
ncbi:MAG: hypothetical protein JWM11_4684 [Planctomycetaceae bacterium]|nr:hypothetical protein [Planctomycetaceae bacterium]